MFITITGQLHDDMMVFAMNDDEIFEANGVNQNCVLVPTLCLIPSIKVRQTLRFSTRLTGRQEPLHGTSQLIKTTGERFIATFDNSGVAIFIRRTKILHHPAPGKPRDTRYIIVIGRSLNAVDNLTYLGCTLSKISKDDEVNCRIFKTNIAFRRLCGNVSGCRGIKLALRWLEGFHTSSYPPLCVWTVHNLIRHDRQFNTRETHYGNHSLSENVSDKLRLTKQNLCTFQQKKRNKIKLNLNALNNEFAGK